MRVFRSRYLAIVAVLLGASLWLLPHVSAQKQKSTGGRHPRRAVAQPPGTAGKAGQAPVARDKGPQNDPYKPEVLPDGSMIGKPQSGEKGINESVASIMAREQKNAGRPKAPRFYVEREVERDDRPNNPLAPAVASWPPVSGDDVKKGVTNTGVAVPNVAQTVSTPNFLGATLTDTGAFPPDTMGTVGPTQFIVAVNGRLRSFNKTTGAADGALNVDMDTFFASVTTPIGGAVVLNFTSDPRIRYDRLSGRWFIIIIDVPCTNATCTTTAANRVLIAVSSGQNITAASDFTFFQYQISTTNFADYPTLGIDANALYIGANMFTSAGSFAGCDASVVQKSSILGAGPIVFTRFTGITGASGAGPFTPQGVDNYDPAATEGYFIGVDNAVFSLLQIRRVSNPGGTPTLSANISLTVPTTTSPNPVTHLGNTGGNNGRLDSLDDRLYAAHFRNGSLWTAHNFRVNASGVASTVAAARNATRWYEIRNLSTTPTLFQSGTIFDSAATLAAAQQYWIPSVMVSGQGHAAFGFSAAGTAFSIDAATTGRLAGDTLGTTQGPPTRYTSTSTAYNPASDPGGASGRRWGDYSYTSLDPNDDMTMWTIQEYCQAANSYGVRAVRLLAPAPTAAACGTATDIIQGGNGNVTITGTGFYDPPATLSGRIPISASVSGTGVTVNSVTFTNATSVTVNVTVAPGATVGTRTVTITNPDGQTASTATCLNITPSAVCTPGVINSSVALTTTQSGPGLGVQPTTCGAAGYSNDFVISATLTNASTSTLTNLSFQVVDLTFAGGADPAIPFRLTSADGATCTTGGLTGATQSIPGVTLAPGQSTVVTIRIAMPSVRRFRVLLNVVGCATSVGMKSQKSTVEPLAFDIDAARGSVMREERPAGRPAGTRATANGLR